MFFLIACVSVSVTKIQYI